ncbi:MAG: septum formation protein Maf [Sedimentisphaerales bacterium]|nr:septum formation protein Maf [Sedimentisphaerales bacterium]MBN2843696.1 septum formation protein Maf [Sedimentisphaerales bacterium]
MSGANITGIILASGSPRRRGLLAELVAEFTVIVPELTEPVLPDMECQAADIWVESLAYLKAAQVAQSHAEQVVIAADTVCVHSGRIIGKPEDQEHARKILTDHFAGNCQVITGLAVLWPAKRLRLITHAITELEMRAMTASELEQYLASGLWEGKAGAYAYQEGGDRFVISRKGSESNIVGLPLELLGDILRANGITNS